MPDADGRPLSRRTRPPAPSSPTHVRTQAAKDVCRVAVLGASGYTGAEVARLCALHPNIKITALTGDKQAGKARARPQERRGQPEGRRRPANPLPFCRLPA